MGSSAPPNAFFNGSIDELSVYNRALSDGEISALYAAGAGGKCQAQVPITSSIALYAGVTIAGAPGYTYGIQSNTDLNNTNGWRGLTNIVFQGANPIWVDVNQPATQGQRYYRVLPGPISIP